MSDRETPFNGLVRSFQIQGAICDGMGSPFSGAVLAAAARDMADGGPTRALMSRWAEVSARPLLTDAVPIRLLGALHDLALSGEDDTLADAYPNASAPGDAAAAWSAALAAMGPHNERLARFLDHEPQTNEVRRSACLLPGFLQISAETGLPLRVFEIGASAGLNQLWDRYRYDLGEAGSWGPEASPVKIPADWRGSPPALDAEIDVVERAACDRKPVDLADPGARQRLRAYVWADQRDRMRRLDAAIDVARAAGVFVENADALDWTARRVAPEEGVVTVLVHSVFWQYMPAATRGALERLIHEIGGKARAAAPFAWLRMEPPPDNLAIMELRLTLWPGGEDRRLATVHPHGAWVEWEGG